MDRRMPVRQKRKKSKVLTVTLSVIVSILTLMVLGILIFSIWLNRNYFVVIVDGTSMNDTLSNDDRLYASYKTNAQRGDIIVIDATNHSTFANKDGSEKLLIKRLIAIEGDVVSCRDGKLYLNGELLDEPYLNQLTSRFDQFENNEITVGEGEIFFLGDNRSNSKDARDSGCMSYGDIVGVVPKWAVRNKGSITKWEKFRKSVSDFFAVGTLHRTGGD